MPRKASITGFKKRSKRSFRDERSKRSSRDETRPAQDVQFRVAVMGAAGVGKSDLISQLLNSPDNSVNNDLADGRNRLEFNVTWGRLTLDVLDTASGDSCPALRELVVSLSDAFVLMYSADDETSFNTVSMLKDEILETKGTDKVPILVVANKMDRHDATNREQHVQHVINEMVVCEDWGLGFQETSLTQDSLSGCRMFSELLRRVPDSAGQLTEVSAVLERRMMMDSGRTTRRRSSTLFRLSQSVRKLFKRISQDNVRIV